MSTKTLAPSAVVVTARDSKGLKFMSIVEAAYNKAGLQDGAEGTPEGEAQRVNEAPGLAELIGEFIGKHRTLETFANEEVVSNYGYLSGYKPCGIVPQTNRLCELFSGLGYANQDLLTQIEKGEVTLPAGAEGWFAIPNIWKKGGQPKIGATYSECIQTVLNLIKKTRNGKFYNYRDGSIDERHLRQLAKTKSVMEAISEAQGNPDILIIAGQFGKRHAGRSVRRARVVMTSGEFGLGAFAIGCMLLTHPERLMNYDDLWVDCAGDEFSPGGDGFFSCAPYFRFDGDKVKFVTYDVDDAYDFYGTASGFPSQS
jgi:hypothetical protein